ncbi:MAG TPA: ABC transporter substrate-binding protein [Candidatus Dormibacteraeota bacterium]|nr:ABC transporter substrate-binding protein [Candidatus Dormibacteraeota bacterium]
MLGPTPRVAVFAALGGIMTLFLAACGGGAGASTGNASSAPKHIVIGTVYAGSGPFADSSLPEYQGLQFWIRHENATGGVYVKAFAKKIPIKLVALNDQSSTTTATTQYEQLVTQDNINIFVPDFGSVLTLPAVTIAAEHHMLLFDQTATGAPLFTPGNKYIVLCDLPLSAIWPAPLAHFILGEHISRVAILYGANDFDATQAAAVKSGLAQGGVTPVYYQSVPTTTTAYGTLLHDIAATNPQAVIELGYASNDIPFLQAVQQGGYHFHMVMTAFPGQQLSLIGKAVGPQGLAYTYTYGVPPYISFSHVSEGLNTSAFIAAFGHGNIANVSFENVAGYNTGLIIQAALGHASKFTQLSMRSALAALSGHFTTLDGAFQINAEGGQTGELLPLAQLLPSGSANAVKIVYPQNQADHAAVYPAP